MMFPLIPYKRIVISTSLTVDETVEIISDAISPWRTLNTWNSSSTKEFEGMVNTQKFKIQKIIYHRNSFLPIIYGRIIPSDKGTTVIAHITLDIFVAILSIIWLIGMGSFSLFSIINVGNLPKSDWASLAGIGLFFFMLAIGFGIYAKATEKFIIKLFEEYKINA